MDKAKVQNDLDAITSGTRIIARVVGQYKAPSMPGRFPVPARMYIDVDIRTSDDNPLTDDDMTLVTSIMDIGGGCAVSWHPALEPESLAKLDYRRRIDR